MNSNEILIISGTPIISGAEFVLSDYLNKTSYINKINILHSDYEHVIDFYKGFKNKSTYKSKYLNPTGASGNILNKLRKIIYILCSTFILGKILFRKDIKIVLGNNTGDVMYSFFSKLLCKKHINYIHDTIDESLIHKIMIKFFDRFVYKYITVSDSVTNSLISIGISKDKIKRIYNGLEHNKINKGSDNDDIVFGFVGNIIDRKNPLEFVEIINYLTNKSIKNENIKGKIVYGKILDNNLYNKLLDEINNKKLNIEIIGPVERSKMNLFYSSLNYLVVCSKQDPLPTVVLEAFNNFTPVIGKNIGGIPEMITDKYNGFLYSKISDFNEIYKLLFSNQKIFGSNANKTITRNFDINKKVIELDNLLFN